MASTHIALPLPIFNELTSYLASRPYSEVANLFTMVKQQAQGITIAPAEPPPAGDQPGADAAAEQSAD